MWKYLKIVTSICQVHFDRHVSIFLHVILLNFYVVLVEFTSLHYGVLLTFQDLLTRKNYTKRDLFVLKYEQINTMSGITKIRIILTVMHYYNYYFIFTKM